MALLLALLLAASCSRGSGGGAGPRSHEAILNDMVETAASLATRVEKMKTNEDVNRHAGVAKHSDYAVMGHGGRVTARNGKLQLKRMDEEPVDIEPESDVPSKQAHFLDCLESGEPTITGIDDAIDTLRVCLAFNRSAESGKVEDC